MESGRRFSSRSVLYVSGRLAPAGFNERSQICRVISHCRSADLAIGWTCASPAPPSERLDTNIQDASGFGFVYERPRLSGVVHVDLHHMKFQATQQRVATNNNEVATGEATYKIDRTRDQID